MTLEIVRPGRPLDGASLCEAEGILGYSLPGDYRRWIAEHNGGIPRPAWFCIRPQKKGRAGTGDWRHVDVFYELDNPAPLAMSSVGVRTILREGQVDPVLPRRLLPIGSADEELHLLLSLDGPDAGCVYLWTLHSDEFWEVERDVDGEPLDTELHRVAASFAEFLEMFTDAPPEVKEERGIDFDGAAVFDPQAMQTYMANLSEEDREEARLQMLIMSGTADSARQAMDEGLSPEKVLMIAEAVGKRDLADAARERLGDKPVWPAAEGFTAAFWSDAAAVRRRMEEGAPIAGPTPDDSTPLHGAAAAGCIESIRLLLESGADPAARNAAGRTPLHTAAAGPDRAEAVAFLLDHGAPAGVFDNDGEMALHKAAGLSGCLETMKRLIDAGEDLHARAGVDRGEPMPEGMSDLMRQSLAQLTNLGNPFDVPPEEMSDDPELREALAQLSSSPLAQFARRITADPEGFLQQHQLQMSQGRTAYEVLQMRMIPSGRRMIPGTEVAQQLDAYQRQRRR
jgi:hypothetical protein